MSTDPELLTHVDDEGNKWFAGMGNNSPGTLMVVFQAPKTSESNINAPFTDKQIMLAAEALKTAGVNPADCYFTYAVKHATYQDKTPNQSLKKKFRTVIEKEIEAVKPGVIVTLGTPAFEIVYAGKKKVKVSDYLGTALPHPKHPEIPVIPLVSPGYILRSPQFKSSFFRDFAAAVAVSKGGTISTKADIDFMLVNSRESLVKLAECIENEGIGDDANDDFIVLDVETGGGRWPHDDKSYTRTVQLGWKSDRAAVIVLYPCGTFDPIKGRNLPDCCPWDDYIEFMKWLKERAYFCGHNGKYDLRYLLTHGIDYTDKYVYDTELAEHLIDNTLTFSLNDMALRYTQLGRYDGDLIRFKTDNPDKVGDSSGYGNIPDEILYPYAAADVLAPRIIFHKQLPKIQEFIVPRGTRSQYPSLLAQEVQTDMDLITLENSGIPCNTGTAAKLATDYEQVRSLIGAKLATIVGTKYPDIGSGFNCRSVVQVRKLLFSDAGLNLTPICTTDVPTKTWEWVLRQPEHIQKNHSPHTGLSSLKILYETTHLPELHLLISYRQIDQVCKNFLRTDNCGGINGNIWPDGRLHPSYSQLSDTGRLRSANPNVQNWSKQAERFYARIFEEYGKQSTAMRTIVEAPPGWYIVECDYRQAELFLLAGVSGDTDMLGALETPGRDLHDEITIEAFDFSMYYPDGTPVNEQELIATAAQDIAAFEKIQKNLIYRSVNGEELSRKDFKAGPRIAGKAVNFGIPYGRGAAAIATQIYAETGRKVETEVVQAIIDSWKKKFHKAWEFMCQCHRDVEHLGMVRNVWGRIRRFPNTGDKMMLKANQREGGNYPIQSGVGGIMRIAMSGVIRDYRERQMQARVINQIHDALLSLCPEDELEAVKGITKKNMTAVEIPLPGNRSMTLDVDTEVFTQWGEKIN